MTYRGKIENGVVVLDQRPELPEGTLVEVVPLPVRRVGAALEKLAGKARGLPKDLARRHDHYRRVRNK